MTSERKRDDEHGMTALICGLFIAVLITCEVLYKHIGVLFHSWLVVPWAIIHLALAYCTVLIICCIDDPDFDKFRKYAIYIAIAGILLVMGHRADWFGKQGILDDSKQESLK